MTTRLGGGYGRSDFKLSLKELSDSVMSGIVLGVKEKAWEVEMLEHSMICGAGEFTYSFDKWVLSRCHCQAGAGNR